MLEIKITADTLIIGYYFCISYCIYVGSDVCWVMSVVANFFSDVLHREWVTLLYCFIKCSTILFIVGNFSFCYTFYITESCWNSQSDEL